MQDNCIQITPENEQGQKHGYWEVYRKDGSLWYIENHIHGKKVGYYFFCWFDGPIEKEFYAR